jgi:hypothetical protein
VDAERTSSVYRATLVAMGAFLSVIKPQKVGSWLHFSLEKTVSSFQCSKRPFSFGGTLVSRCVSVPSYTLGLTVKEFYLEERGLVILF